MRNAWAVSLLMAVLSSFPPGGLAGTSSMPGHAEGFWFGDPGSASEVTRIVPMEAKGFRFLPGKVIVHVGDTVRFEITNHDTIEHEFVLGDVPEQAAHEKEMRAMPSMPMHDENGVPVPPGKTSVLIWTFTHAGELEYACHVPGHYAAGMVGWIIVRP